MSNPTNKKSERGIALLVALFALILISAVGLAMMFSSDGEFSTNGSFRQNKLAFFAARSGLEVARDRMRYASTDLTNPAGMGISDLLTLPAPGLNSLGQTNSVLYIVNGAGIDPTNFNNPTYFDDELCHEVNNPALIANSPGSFNIKCPANAGSLPTAAGWATQIPAEPTPNGGARITWAWTRINLKLQESTSPWCVLGLGVCNQQTGADSVADQVCFDGNHEFVLSDAMPAGDAPGGIGGITPAQQVGAIMYFGTTGKGASGHSATAGTGTTSTGGSTTGTTTGTTGTTTGTTTGGSTTGGTTGGSGSGGACSGVFTPPAPSGTIAASSCSSANAQPVYTLTTLALTPAKARRMLQYEIARLTIPPLPAAVTLAGPSPNFSPTNSANFAINGNDQNSCSGTNPGHQANNVPALGTTTDVGNSTETASQVASDSASTIATALTGPGVKTNLFTGAGCSTGDDVQNVINVDPAYNTVAGLNDVVQSVIGAADQIVSSSSAVTNWGTSTTPQVIAIEGDATISSGSGILLVTGNLTISGSFTWNGTILAIGNGSVTFQGGGGGVINGAILVANIGNPSYASNPTNSANLLAQLGSPSFNFNGGGNNSINYDSCLTTAASAHATYKVLARREIVY